MLEEQSREEKSGYKAEFSSAPKNDYSKKPQKTEEEIADAYGDDFESEIDEDLPVDDLLASDGDMNRGGGNAAQSLGGITVS